MLNDKLIQNGFYGDIPKGTKNYSMCSEAYMVEMDLKTNFLRSKKVAAYLDTELTLNGFA